MKLNYRLLMLVMLVTLFFISSIAANAADGGWQVVVRSSRLPNYFNYPSTLKSIIKLSVVYQQGDGSSSSKLYETLYYNASLPIGCDKHNALLPGTGQGGFIRIDSEAPDEMKSDECDAIVNASGRLFLDLYLKNYPIYDIVVPAASFDALVAAFQRSGFYNTDPSNSPHLVLSVVSQPPGRCQAMAF